MTETIEARRKRLLYRAMHRGFKEADIIIGGFATAHIQTMTVAELDEFEELIGFPDKELYEWIIGRQQAPANLSGPIFTRLQAFDAVQEVRNLTSL